MKKSTTSSALLVGAGFLATAAFAQVDTAYGPITSNLKRVLCYYYGYSSDHANTPAYAGYLKSLGNTYGFQVDTASSQSVFTAANLANYQVIVLHSALNFGVGMNATQKAAVEAWYGNNRGMGCFHQCVKNTWGGSYPNWYDSLMGTKYETWAGFGTGPVYVNPAVVGTDLAMGITSNGTTTAYTANYTQKWDDEWYTFTGTPEANGLGGKTRLIWTTHRGDHTFGTNFATSGETQAMSWAREVKGGRFVLNAMFHQDMPRTSTNADLRKFVDGAWIGILRYLAGYSGCKDSNYVEYNPKATHQGSGACITSKTTQIRILPLEFGHGIRVEDLKVAFTSPGAHSVRLVSATGKVVAFYQGDKPQEYDFARLSLSGVYFVTAKFASRTVLKRIRLL